MWVQCMYVLLDTATTTYTMQTHALAGSRTPRHRRFFCAFPKVLFLLQRNFDAMIEL